jgi:riboflavin kinase/FMN adenylyltransferase
MISTGNMEMTAKLLGRPYSFAGRVSHGKRLGSRMGIPTINIPAPQRQMLPPNGVYFSRISIDGREYASVSNLGINPTVNSDGSIKTIEANIFDFDEDVYGSEVTVSFDHFSRGERKFRDKEELFAQIARDCENAIEYRKKR